jgi:hypothetical protein
MSGPYTYYPTIPQATDQISNSQPQIQNNFTSIMSLIDVNHGDFATSVAGQHTYVQMTNQSMVPAVNNPDVGLYNYSQGGPGNNQMWVRKADGTPDVPMTASSQANVGWAYLPSGIILKWGFFNAPPGISFQEFPVASTIPVFSAVFEVMITTLGLAANVFVTSGGAITTGINVNATQRTTTNPAAASFAYLAIGK